MHKEGLVYGKVKICAYRSSRLVRNELPRCSYCAASKQFKSNFEAKALRDACQQDLIPSCGRERGNRSSWCREPSCFPSLGKSASISVLWWDSKGAAAISCCEMLPKILIFKVCRLLAMMKTLACGSQDQGKSAFLDRTSVENIRETGRALACC